MHKSACEAETSPSLQSSSGLMNSGFPAKAEGLLYGELPKTESTGVSGSTCQREKPAPCRKSANLRAPFPKSPTPHAPGSDDLCKSTPLLREPDKIKPSAYTVIKDKNPSCTLYM